MDAGSAATTALEVLAEDAKVVATFDADRLFDYRARRPPLEIVDGRLTELTWHELVLRRTRIDERDCLILVGPEPDYRWRAFTRDVIDLVRRLGVNEWISLGAIPAAVPAHQGRADHGDRGAAGSPARRRHRGTGGHAAGAVRAHLRDRARGRRGRHPRARLLRAGPPLRVGAYATAAVQLLRAIGTHLGAEIPARALVDESRELRARLDTATGLDDTTRSYVERLETMYDEQRLPSGDDLISDIERFLRDQGTPGGTSGLPN